MSEIRAIDSEDWRDAMDWHIPHREDRFAGTFLAKANAMNLWPGIGAFVDVCDAPAAGLIMRTTRRGVANLQLLHTFYTFRRRGLASVLFDVAYESAIEDGAQYFRVSAEPDALPFYHSKGCKFWGRQKSGSHLCMFRIGRGGVSEYDVEDKVVRAALFGGRRGCLTEVFEDGPR